jgi:hypothetical protein
MRPLSPDTPLHVERLWIAGLREKGPLWRLTSLVNLVCLCWRATDTACRRARPQASNSERDFCLLQERYGSDIARRVVELRRQRGFYDGQS